MYRRFFITTVASVLTAGLAFAKKKIRQTISGFGKSLSEAMTDCYRNARLVSTSYQTISRSSSGSGSSWTYTMVIEYED